MVAVGMALGSSAVTACKTTDLSMRGIVSAFTYSGDGKKKPEPAPPVDQGLYVYAMLRPLMERPFLECSKAQAALRRVNGAKLYALGRELRATLNAREWSEEVLNSTESYGVASDDKMVLLAIGEMAEAIAGYQSSFGTLPTDTSAAGGSGAGSGGAPSRPELGSQIAKAVDAAILKVTGQLCEHPLDGQAALPSLALSGGSANGAFVAGYLYQLLYLRERLVRQLPLEQRQAFLDSSRFAGAAGTSVGSLIATVLDLYFTPVGEVSDKQWAAFDLAWKRAMRWRYDSVGEHFGPGSVTPVWDGIDPAMEPEPCKIEPGKPPCQEPESFYRIWALSLLIDSFSDLAEPQAICVQPTAAARLGGLLGPHHPGLMRFDPLQQHVIDPVLGTNAKVMVKNPFRRSVVSVEISQNLTVSLDDSVCPTDDMTAASRCLASGVMASTVLPAFAQPVNRVRTGISDQDDCGIWLDGGVRSGLPAYYSLMMTRPSCPAAPATSTLPQRYLRVLALSTGRLNGMPSRRADEIYNVGLEVIGEMGSQVLLSEVKMVESLAERQEARWAAFCSSSESSDTSGSGGAAGGSAGGAGGTGAGGTGAGGAPAAAAPIEGFAAEAGPPASTASLEVVFVPGSLPEHLVFGTGYRFDPFVMRGLFAYGRQVAWKQLTQDDLAKVLRWSPAALAHPKFRAYIEADGKRIQQLVDVYGKNDTEQARMEAGRKRFEQKEVLDCPEAPTYAEAPMVEKGSGDAAAAAARTDVPPAYFGGTPGGDWECREPSTGGAP